MMKTHTVSFRWISLVLMLAAVAPCFAQVKIKLNTGCSWSGKETGKEFIVSDPSKEIEKIVQAMLNKMSIPKTGFTLKKSEDVQNAMASTAPDGQRYILYNERFLAQFKQDPATVNAAYAVLAHEIGHHVQNHKLDLTDLSKAKDQELEADYFAGGVLFALCRSLKEATSALSVLPDKSSATHPSRFARETKVKEGWETRKRVEGENPCDRMRPLTLKSLGVEGRAENIRGRINDEKIEFTYDVKSFGDKTFRPYIVINSEMIEPKPENIEWVDDLSPIGSNKNKSVIWHYARERARYTPEMVEKKDWYSIAVLRPKDIRKRTKPWAWGLLIGGAVVGAGAMTSGILMQGDADKMYEDYKKYNDPDPEITTFYTDKSTTRAAYLETINSTKRVPAQWLGYGGGVLFGVTGTWIVTKLCRKVPNVYFYASSPSTGNRGQNSFSAQIRATEMTVGLTFGK